MKMVQNTKLNKSDLLLYAVTDRLWTKNKSLYEQAEEALSGGVTCMQLREKELAYDEFLNEAKSFASLCKRYSVPLIINDNIDVAVNCNADGLHIGQKDISCAEARRIIGDKMILGVSAQTAEQAVKAENDGADYLGVGAVFSTSTKLDADSVSFAELKKICESVAIPVIAIGGISENNIHLLKDSGICGVALVSAIFSKADIKNECIKLKHLSEELFSR